MGAIEHNPSLRIGLKEPIVQTITSATRRRYYKFQDTFFEFHIDKSRSFHSKSPESQTELFKMKTGYIQTNFQ